MENRVVNCVEEMVWAHLDDYLKNCDVCKCEQCKSDIAAYALNELKPKYVSHKKGEAYSRFDVLETQYKVSMIQAFTKAVQVVSSSPRH